MQESQRALLIVAFAVAGLLAPGCAGLRDISIFTTEQEVELGRRVSEEVESQVRLLDDPPVVAYVRRVGASVAAKAQRQDVTYVFKVIDDSGQVNAFAVPGGNIYIFTGMLTRMDSEAELAAVLGHEAAHIAERHSMEALTKQVGRDIMLQALLGEEAAAWQVILADVGSDLVFLKFTRKDEEEADRLGLQYMYEAGYDPNGMVGLLQLFVELSQGEPSTIEVWLSTHPAPGERVKNVKQIIQKQNLTGGKTGAEEYRAAMEGIKTTR